MKIELSKTVEHKVTGTKDELVQMDEYIQHLMHHPHTRNLRILYSGPEPIGIGKVSKDTFQKIISQELLGDVKFTNSNIGGV